VHALEVSLPRLVEEVLLKPVRVFPTDLLLRGGIVVGFFYIVVKGYSLVKDKVRKTIIVKEKKKTD
jgi:hypothetical protein